MGYSLSIIDFAHIDCGKQLLLSSGSSEERQEIGCFSWLLSCGDRHILIDTGIADIDIINTTVLSGGKWVRQQTLEDGLSKAGITPTDISAVILTHAHYDHISNLPKCTNTRVYIHQNALSAVFDESNSHYSQLEEVRSFLKEKDEEGMVTAVADCLSLGEDIQIQHVGGHTAGSQIVFIKTDKGNCLMTGDAVFLTENVEKNIPIGLTQNEEESANVLKICREFEGRILPSHDLSILKYFEGGNYNV